VSARYVPTRGVVIASLALLCAVAVSCAPEPPDIEFACSVPTWSTDKELSTIYSIRFSTSAVAMPWPCSAIVSLDLYDLDGYVHAIGTYVIDIEATVELGPLERPWDFGAESVVTVDLATLGSPRETAGYTNRVRGVRAVVPRQVEFQPDNPLLHPSWWILPFEAVEEAGAVAGYVADSLPD